MHTQTHQKTPTHTHNHIHMRTNTISRHCWRIKMYGTWFFNEKKKQNLPKQPKWKSTETIRTIHSNTRSQSSSTTHRHFIWFFVLGFFILPIRFGDGKYSKSAIGIDRTNRRKFQLLFFAMKVEGKKIIVENSHRFLCACVCAPVCVCVYEIYPKKKMGTKIYIFNKQTLVKTLKSIFLFFLLLKNRVYMQRNRNVFVGTSIWYRIMNMVLIVTSNVGVYIYLGIYIYMYISITFLYRWRSRVYKIHLIVNNERYCFVKFSFHEFYI